MNVRIWLLVASLGVAPLLSATAAFATPLISGCTDNGDGTQTCNFYETDANGSPSEISSPVFNQFSTTSSWNLGYSAINDPDGTLSDIIVWTAPPGSQPGTLAQYGTLYSCDDGGLANNCDTTGLTLLGTGFEDASGDLVGATKARYLDTGLRVTDILNVYSPTEVPEPITLALFGAGLLGLGALSYRRKAKA